MSECNGPNCIEQLTWAKFANSGRPAPFDSEQIQVQGDPGESLWVLEDDQTGPRVPGLLARRAQVGEVGVTCHFATCIDGERFRKKG